MTSARNVFPGIWTTLLLVAATPDHICGPDPKISGPPTKLPGFQ